MIHLFFHISILRMIHLFSQVDVSHEGHLVLFITYYSLYVTWFRAQHVEMHITDLNTCEKHTVTCGMDVI